MSKMELVCEGYDFSKEAKFYLFMWHISNPITPCVTPRVETLLPTQRHDVRRITIPPFFQRLINSSQTLHHFMHIFIQSYLPIKSFFSLSLSLYNFEFLSFGVFAARCCSDRPIGMKYSESKLCSWVSKLWRETLVSYVALTTF